MSDNLVLYGPGGASPVNLGSWLRADPGPDFGARGLVEAIEAESFADGGQFVYERAGIRHMGFPLMAASGGAGLSLTGLESLIRLNARPGGYLDVQPHGTPSSEAVRFDIVHGRWEPEYSVYTQKAARRPGTLYLDTQPYGYWPTWITLASVASVAQGGAPLQQPVAMIYAASVIGDAPAPVRLRFFPILGLGGGNRGYPDFAAWAIGGPTTLVGVFNPVLAPPAFSFWQSGSLATVSASDGTASFLNGQTTRWWGWDGNGLGSYQSLLEWAESAQYQGRFRAFVWARFWQPTALAAGSAPLNLTLDVSWGKTAPLASTARVATVVPIASTNYRPAATTAALASDYGLYDLGEIKTPPAEAAGHPSVNNWYLRLWGYYPGFGAAGVAAASAMRAAVASTVVDIAELVLLPVDGDSGILPRGLSQPSIVNQTFTPTYTGIQIDTASRMVFAAQPSLTADLADAPVGALSQNYIGGYPRLYPGSTTFLTVMLEQRLGGTGSLGLFNYASGLESGPPMRDSTYATGYALAYRPTFQFLKGL